jgi:hypothetical protein
MARLSASQSTSEHHPPFFHKSDSLTWARQQELEADRLGVPNALKGFRGVIVADIIIWYRDEVVPGKRSA